jgi:hypothetical protein
VVFRLQGKWDGCIFGYHGVPWALCDTPAEARLCSWGCWVHSVDRGQACVSDHTFWNTGLFLHGE